MFMRIQALSMLTRLWPTQVFSKRYTS